jgi:hypothetical protein
MVCGWCGLAGNVRDSHIVAFLRKVMVVRDASVFPHWRIPLFAGNSVRHSESRNFNYGDYNKQSDQIQP